MAVQPLTNAILVGLEAENPTGNPWFDITPATADVAFQSALDALSDQGGTLYVLPMGPSTTAYTFSAQVTVTKPNVAIEFLGGSVLAFPTSGTAPANLFLVTAGGFRCQGARVVHAIQDANNLADRSCFRVEADDATFLDCSFDLTQGVSQDTVVIQSFSCIRAHSDPPPNEDPIRRNLKVSRCTFVFQPGTTQDEPWIDPMQTGVITQPRGVCCIRATRLRGCALTENHFRSGSTTQKGDCGPVIYLLAVEECSLSSNTIRGLKTPAGGTAPDLGTLVRLRSSATLEGHHTVVSCNVAVDIDSSHVFVLDGERGVNYDYLTGNVIDQIQPSCRSVIYGEGGAVLGVVGNTITRVGPASGAEGAIHLDSVHDVTIASNVFAGLPATLRPIQLEACANVQVSPYQARAETP